MKILKWFAVFLIPVSLLALTVNVEEIKTVAPVEFEDYQGPNKIVNTHEEITGIGRNLKRGLKGEKFTWINLYSIVHAIDAKSEKLNADILIIEKMATVDTIYNVRRILSGYLEEAYGYSYNDAFTLATFVTYYNAVYRSKMKYFKGKYTDKVMSYLSAANVGLARTYKEWPGKSRIVIPLAKGEARLDTSKITDKNVIQNIRKTESDRGVPERKKIVEIKKDELKKDQSQLQKKTEEIQMQEKTIQRKEKEIVKKIAAIEKIENPQKKETAKQEVEKEQKALKEEKQNLEQQKEEVKQDEKDVQTKSAEIKQDENDIATDEKLNDLEKNPKQAVKELEATQSELSDAQAELKKEKDSIMQGKLYYLKVKEWLVEGHYDNDLVIIDPRTRKVSVRSPVKRIDCNKYLLNMKGVVVILHNENKANEHNLALLDKDNLTLIKTGPDNVFWRSFIEDRDGFIYVIINKDDEYYLGRFNYDLQLDQISTVKMDRDSFISFFEDTIYINKSNKNIVVLNKKDLSLLEEIQP